MLVLFYIYPQREIIYLTLAAVKDQAYPSTLKANINLLFDHRIYSTNFD